MRRTEKNDQILNDADVYEFTKLSKLLCKSNAKYTGSCRHFENSRHNLKFVYIL